MALFDLVPEMETIRTTMRKIPDYESIRIWRLRDIWEIPSVSRSHEEGKIWKKYGHRLRFPSCTLQAVETQWAVFAWIDR